MFQISMSAVCSLWVSRVGSASISVSTLPAASTASVQPATTSPEMAAAAQVRVQRSSHQWNPYRRLDFVFVTHVCPSVFRHRRVWKPDAQLHSRAAVCEHLRRVPVCDGRVSSHEERHVHQDVADVRYHPDSHPSVFWQLSPEFCMFPPKTNRTVNVGVHVTVCRDVLMPFFPSRYLVWLYVQTSFSLPEMCLTISQFVESRFIVLFHVMPLQMFIKLLVLKLASPRVTSCTLSM